MRSAKSESMAAGHGMTGFETIRTRTRPDMFSTHTDLDRRGGDVPGGKRLALSAVLDRMAGWSAESGGAGTEPVQLDPEGLDRLAAHMADRRFLRWDSFGV